MCKRKSQNKSTSVFWKELDGIRCRWKSKEIKTLDDLETELYAFKNKHSQHPDYQKLLTHIQNEIVIDNNIHTETSSLAALLVSFVAVVISISEKLGETENLIISLLILAGCVLVIWPVVKGWFTKRIREKNFCEICLNILEEQ